MLPHYLPPWRTVYQQFEAWCEDGTWDRLLTGLRQQLRQFAREAEPTAGAIDSQSVRTGGKREGVSRLRRGPGACSWP
ncbi:MAG: transposase [Hymenobacter sp.]|nr:MAG: transposase [Hymenobacter sp.]